MNHNNHDFDITKWRYYLNTIIPSTPPHISPVLTKEGKKALFKKYPKALMIRWTSDFDCPQETSWWYIIKDTPYRIDQLKAKRRYEITKGRKFFDVKIISSIEYLKPLSKVYLDSFDGYDNINKEDIDIEAFEKEIYNWDKKPHITVFGAFLKEDAQLCGYALMIRQENITNLAMVKTNPKFEKYAINAALMDGVLLHYNDQIEQGSYICDGSRSILHKTHFQDYLEKYFGFKKAYCHLNLHYRGVLTPIIKILTLFRPIFRKLDRISLVHKINGLLAMEDYKG